LAVETPTGSIALRSRGHDRKYAQTLTPGYRLDCTAKRRIPGHLLLSARSGIPGRCYCLFDLTGTLSCTGGAHPHGSCLQSRPSTVANRHGAFGDRTVQFPIYPHCSIIIALIHSVNGFALGAATTLYLAFFVEALPKMKTDTMPWASP